MNILVIDDDETILTAVEHRLLEEGYNIYKATDGIEALEITQKQAFDLIISDIMMPNLSGLSMLNLIGEFTSKKVPVILISSLDQGKHILSALGLGTYDFIAKPINMDDLVLRVKKYQKQLFKPEKF